MSKSPTATKGEKKLQPIHPGRILLEDMKDEEISINGLAQAIRVPANRISLIVNGKRGLLQTPPCAWVATSGPRRSTG